MKITRQYTLQDTTIEYTSRGSLIKDTEGNVVHEQHNVEVPTTWSQLATDILSSKYCYKAVKENSAKQVVHRICSTITTYGATNEYFDSEESASAFHDELEYILLNQVGAFNSPVWFNCGLYETYHIQGSGGNWAIDSYDGKPIQLSNNYERPQCSACFIQSIEDSLTSIYDLLKTENMLFKYGSGTGTNFSPLRSKHERLSGGGTSSGLMSFLEVFDKAAGSTKSGGTTRRAAKMVCLDVNHPEIEDFIDWKTGEERKVKALIQAGYSSDFNGEAYHTVSGQNSNNSVRVTDEFMNAVDTGNVIDLVGRTDGKRTKTVYAKDLWDKICKAAWECADPGLQFDTTINEWHTCPNTGRINASNPCSEYMFLDNTACNLASVNLTKFLQDDNTIDYELYKHTCRILFIAQELLVTLSSYPTEEICKNSEDYRPLGLGYCNLGSLLMQKGIPYDSTEGRSLAATLTSVMTATAYKTSAELARDMGAFNAYAKNGEAMMRVIRKHAEEADDLDDDSLSIWEEAITLGQLYGFRNAQATVLAPTGTIGLLMDCDTTGIEPEFSLVKYKKLAGGGTVKIVNKSVERALKTLGYAQHIIARIRSYITDNGSLVGCKDIQEKDLPVFDTATGERFISPMAHVSMMASVQPFLSGAISKTVNMPHDTTVQEVSDIYKAAWQNGLKAVAIYRDGCKQSQPLNTTNTVTVTPVSGRKKLAKKRFGFTQEAKVGGHKVFLRTGEYEDGTLGEIFIDMHKEGAAFRTLVNCFARAVSLGLQYGVPLDAFVKHFTFTRFDPQGIVEGHDRIKMSTSIVDYIFRVLGLEYLKKDDIVHVKPTETGEEPTAVMTDAPMCNVCGHLTVRNAACYKCLNCGNSMGCS